MAVLPDPAGERVASLLAELTLSHAATARRVVDGRAPLASLGDPAALVEALVVLWASRPADREYAYDLFRQLPSHVLDPFVAGDPDEVDALCHAWVHLAV